MARKAQMSRDQALDYLSRKGLLTKPRDQYTTAYAKRLASQYQRAESSGKQLTRSEARGKHPKKGEQRQRRTPPKVEKVLQGEGPLRRGERRAVGREKAQAVVLNPEIVGDLRRPLKAMGYPVKVDEAEWALLVYGYAQDSPTNRRKFDGSKPVHYRIYTTEENLKYWLGDKDRRQTDILSWVNLYSPYNWKEILSIAVLGYTL